MDPLNIVTPNVQLLKSSGLKKVMCSKMSRMLLKMDRNRIHCRSGSFVFVNPGIIPFADQNVNFIVSYHAIGVPPTIQTRSVSSTTLHESLSVEESAPQIARWGEIRAMTQDEANANLAGEELEAYNRYYKEMREGVIKMQELAQIMMKNVEPPRIAPKTKGQRKRDKWARVQAREAARARA